MKPIEPTWVGLKASLRIMRGFRIILLHPHEGSNGAPMIKIRVSMPSQSPNNYNRDTKQREKTRFNKVQQLALVLRAEGKRSY